MATRRHPGNKAPIASNQSLACQPHLEQLEGRLLLDGTIPGMHLVDPAINRFDGQVVVAQTLSANSTTTGSDVPGVSMGHPLPTDTSPATYCGQNPFFTSGFGGQCTAFCWGRAKEKLGISLPFRGNAQTWWSSAQGVYQTGSNPQANSIAVWSYAGLGHVAFVEEVAGDQVTVNEANVSTYVNTNWGGGYDGVTKTRSAATWAARNLGSSGATQFLGYIYLDTVTSLPAPTLTSPAPGATNVPVTTSFAWSQVTGNQGYRIIISTNSADMTTDPTSTGGTSSGAVVYKNLAANTTSYSYPSTLAAGTLYYWEVHALGTSTANNGYWSQSTFTTAAVSITDQQKQNAILGLVNSHRGTLPTEFVLAEIFQEGGQGAFHVNGSNYNSFYNASDGPWAQPTNGDGIMQNAVAYHQPPYTNDQAGYDHSIDNGTQYLKDNYAAYGTIWQASLHYNTGPSSLYIYKNGMGDPSYLNHVGSNLQTLVLSMFSLSNADLVSNLLAAQQIVNQYLNNPSILSNQSVSYYSSWQTQLDSDLHNIGVVDTFAPTVSAFTVTPDAVIVGNSVTIAFTVSDTGGSGLQRIELWRAPDAGGAPGTWGQVQSLNLSGNGPVSSSFSDTPAVGKWWYGIHVVDGNGNLGMESDSGLGPKPITVSAVSLPTVTIGDVMLTERNTIFSFPVSLSGTNALGASVNYATANGSAAAGSDYAAQSGTITWGAGSTSTVMISITVNDDTTVEPDETFYVNLSSPTNVTLFKSQGVGTIQNDDASTLPELSINDPTPIIEGDSGSRFVTFLVTMSGPGAEWVDFSIGTADGTATAGSDYAPVIGHASFPPGQIRTFRVDVPVYGDMVVEGDEWFSLSLSNVSGATVAKGQGLGIIQNDDRQVADTTPPTPNSSTWAAAPHATGPNSIQMIATTATDPSGVQYFFHCLTAGGHDSGWTGSANFTDTGLTQNTTYTYQVKTRDLSANQNQGSYSGSASATTLTALPADFNGDGKVDGLDFLVWQTGYPNFVGGATRSTGDANGDGKVDGLDFLMWQAGYTSSVPTFLPADFNRDGRVDGLDFLAWQTGYPNFVGGATRAKGDANGDGKVDGLDFLMWQAEYSPQGAAAASERHTAAVAEQVVAASGPSPAAADMADLLAGEVAPAASPLPLASADRDGFLAKSASIPELPRAVLGRARVSSYVRSAAKSHAADAMPVGPSVHWRSAVRQPATLPGEALIEAEVIADVLASVQCV